MADVAELVFEIDSGPARTAASDLIKLGNAALEVSNKGDRLNKAIRDVNGRFLSLGDSISKNDALVSQLSREFNTAASATLKFQQYQIRLNQAVGAGVATEKEAEVMLRRKHAELQRGLPLYQKAAKQAKKLRDEELRAEAAQKKAAQAREAAMREFIPLYAASKQYEESLNRLNAALDAGDLSVNQHKAALNNLNAAYQSSSAAAQRFGQSQDVARHHVANLSFQLNDIGMMMATGQNPFMLMMQQGPQVAQIFSQMNAEGRKLGPTMAGAFRMFLNPTTAVTLALVGGSAALGQWAMSAIRGSDDARKFADSLSDMESALSDLSKFGKFDASTKRINVSLDEIVSKYGAINDGVKNHINLVNQAAIATANLSKNNYMNLFEESFNTSWFRLRAFEIQDAFDTTLPSAIKLRDAMREASEAKGITAQREAAEKLRDEVIAVTGGMEAMNLKQLGFVTGLNTAIDALRQIENQTKNSTDNIIDAANRTADWERNMAAVKSQVDAISRSLSAIGGFQLQAVSANMERRLLETGVAAGEAARQVQEFERAADFMSRRKTLIAEYSGRYTDPGYATAIDLLNQEEKAAKAAADAQYELGQTRDRLAEEERARLKSERSGASAAKAAERRAAAELKAAGRGFQSISELMEQNTLFEYAEYGKRQAQLDAALSKQLLSRQNYEVMKSQLQMLYFGTEYEQQNLRFMMEQQQLDAALEQRRISEERHAQEVSRIRAAQQNAALSGYATFFGNMAQAAQAGGDRTSKIVKAFSIAQGVLNSYLAYTQVLADPSLMGRPFLRTALAASTLAAGLGAVAQMKSGGGGGGSSSASAAVKQEPTRNVLVRMEGPEWMQDIAESVITQIYDSSKDGRVIIARDY